MISQGLQFFQRHRKKLVVAGCTGVVSYYGYKIYKQYRDFQQLVSGGDGAAGDMLSELFAEFGSNEAGDKRKRQQFEVAQKSADQMVGKYLAELKDVLRNAFDIDSIKTRMAAGKDTLGREDKVLILLELCATSLCRAVATILVIHLLALECRVEINVLGRPSAEASEDREMKRIFLRSLQHIMSDQGMEQIVQITRSVVTSNLADVELRTEFSVQSLEDKLDHIIATCIKRLVDNRLVDTVLPQSVSATIGVACLSIDEQKTVEEYLQHTRDVIESEPFEGVLRFICRQASQQFVSGLQVPDNFYWSKVVGPLNLAVDSCFDPESPMLMQFGKYAPVQELCDNIYYEDRAESSNSTPTTVAAAPV